MEKNRDTLRIEREAGQAMKDGSTHKNIATELLDARRGGSAIKHRENFGDDGEIITGYINDRPWDRK